MAIVRVEKKIAMTILGGPRGTRRAVKNEPIDSYIHCGCIKYLFYKNS